MKRKVHEDARKACASYNGVHLTQYSTGLAVDKKLPSERTVQAEQNWYKNEPTYDPTLSDRANFTTAH